MINKSEITLYGITYNESEIKIKSSEELVLQMQKEVDKYTKLLQLAKQDRLNTIKREVSYSPYFTEYEFLSSAQKWLSMMNDINVDKCEEYKEKKCFYKVIENLKNMLNDSEIKVINIIPSGYTNYSWAIIFISKGVTFQIVFPVINELSEKNWDYVCEGKISLYYEESKSCYYSIASSYKEEEICKAYKDFLEKNK